VGDHLRLVVLDPLLVAPGARLQAPLQEDLLALAEVLVGDLGQLLVADDGEPLRLLALVAATGIPPAAPAGDAEVGHRLAVGHVAHFRVFPTVSYDLDLIE